MTYNIKKTASTSTDYVVNNHTINKETMLSLIGKSYVGYGDELQQNTVDLLCNFYTQSTDYQKAIPGQLIYDGTNLKLCIDEKTFINLLLLPCDSGDNSLPTGDVTVSGTLSVGQKLTASNTIKDVDGIHSSITYEWFINGASMATGPTYIPTIPGTLIVRASYKDGLNNNEHVNSSSMTINTPVSGLSWAVTTPFTETSANDGTILGIITITANNCNFSSTYPYDTIDGKSKLLTLTNVLDSNGKSVNITSVDSTVISRTDTQLVVKVIFKTNSTLNFTSGSFVLNQDAII